MRTQIAKIKEIKKNIPVAMLFDSIGQIPQSFLTGQEKKYLAAKIREKTEAVIYRYPSVFFFHKIKKEAGQWEKDEKARKAGADFFRILKKENLESVQIIDYSISKSSLSFLEGMLLASYSFSKYKKEKDAYLLKQVFVSDRSVSEDDLREITVITESVFMARDLVNEPLSGLTALKLSEEIKKAGEATGFSVEVFKKQKITSLKMGGLLAVNKGSIDTPTFTVAGWKPENAVNKKPFILVGKGVVYDTGGLSLKPTQNSMDYMKSDMSGAATVAAVVFAIAKLKLPVHIVGLIPATDNRPGGNAYVPGDIITMFDGTTVEIKNTDAEGRLLLADALSYAKKYGPQLVVDVATLTGTAQLITSDTGIAAMGNTPEVLERLKQKGEEVYERVVELPLWEEFAEPLKSPVADLNNLGVREGQASIAGKFLEHFTGYPWIHLDIAGAAFISEEKTYRAKGGTGIAVRLLYHFFKDFMNSGIV